jgi:hypothetical protein
MDYLNPQIAREELSNVARGLPSSVPINTLAAYVLNCGLAAGFSPAPKDDFVRFAKRLHRLKDTRCAA